MNNLTNSTTPSWIPDRTIIFIHGINLILGFPLNIYIIVLYFGRRRKLDLSDIFTLNQAAAEIFFMLLSPFHAMCAVTLELCFLKVVGFFHGCGMTVRPLLQCLVCLERYIAVVHPVTFLKFKPLRYHLIPSVVAWMIELVCRVTSMMTYPRLPYNLFVTVYVIILMLTTFSCLSVLKKLKHPGPGDGDKKREDGVKKRAFQIITFNLLMFLIQNIPLTITFGIQNKVPAVIFRICAYISLALMYFTGLLQAVFLLHRAGKLTFMKCVCF